MGIEISSHPDYLLLGASLHATKCHIMAALSLFVVTFAVVIRTENPCPNCPCRR